MPVPFFGPPLALAPFLGGLGGFGAGAGLGGGALGTLAAGGLLGSAALSAFRSPDAQRLSRALGQASLVPLLMQGTSTQSPNQNPLTTTKDAPFTPPTFPQQLQSFLMAPSLFGNFGGFGL